jgi:endoglucanase Acf2
MARTFRASRVVGVVFACLLLTGAVVAKAQGVAAGAGARVSTSTPHHVANPAVVADGAGAYATVLPAGAKEPTSTIYTTETGPVRTHQYWSSKLWTPLNNGGYNIIPQPLFTSVTANGMLVGIHGDLDGYPADDATAVEFYQYPNFDLTIGYAGLNATSVPISASSDWSADFQFSPSLTLRTGRGMPFVYALTDGTPLTVTFARAATVLTNNTNILVVSTPEGDGRYTNYYALFCPAGGAWAQSGQVFTCNAPAGAHYASVALLPGVAASPNGNVVNMNQTTIAQQLNGNVANTNQTTIAQQLTDFTKVAFSFPTNTQVSWQYNQSSSTVTTTYTVTTQSMDGTSSGFLSALYPTQYDAMPSGVNTPYTYLTNHGVMKVNSGTSFTTTDTFHGVLPMMPPTSNFKLPTLKSYVDAAPGATLQASDYEQGKVLGAAAQDLALAKLADPAAYTTLQAGLQNVLQTWFTATPTGTSDLFYYDSQWGTMIGYPASFDSDDQLNDHHFHYGYFIHAAAINGLFNPSWVAMNQYGGMVRLLQQDIANYDRTNTMFPFMRHFDVYAGHSWASGQAPFADGENQESSSEAVNAWTGMILLGAATGDTQLRDAGIWLYTQETKAVAYYWLNEKPTWVNANAATTFPTWFAPLRIANEYDDKGDTATFFGANPDFEHGIEFLPFTGGSLHLGLSPSYVEKNYQEDVAANTTAGKPAGDWPDLMAEYEAFSNPTTALTQLQNVTTPTDGETLAHEYAWVNSLAALGQVDASVTANTPYYAVFNNNGTLSHVAFNPSSSAVTVTFSDGTTLNVPAGTLTSDNSIVTTLTFGVGVTTTQPPAAPTGVSATAKSSSEIDLAWVLVPNVTYTVYRSTTSGFTPSPATQVAAGLTAAAYADTGLAASTTYYYVVEAVNAGGSSGPSAQASATTSAGSGGGSSNVAEPNTLYLVGGATATMPSQLSFTTTPAVVDTIPANPAAAMGTPTNPLTYTISGVSGTYNAAATTAFDAWVDAGTNPGEGVQVEVSYDLNGSGTYTRTELYSFFATDPVVGYEDANQTARGGLVSATGTLGNMTNGSVRIQIWNALPGTNDAPITLSTGNNTAALSDVVIPFTNVTYAVTPPVTPTGVTATAVGSSSVNVMWTASGTGATYSIYRSTVSGFTPGAKNMVAAGIAGTSYTDVNLDPSTTYYYVVEAVNALGSSAPSTPAMVTTPAQVGVVSGSNVLYFVAGANATTPSKLSFVAGPLGTDTIPVNNPQSPGVAMNPLVYKVTGLNGTYQSAQATAFDAFIDAGTNVGEAAQVEVFYDLNGTGTYDRTELYNFFATDPVIGYEDYNQGSRGGLSAATGTLGDMKNGTIVIEVWNALPGPNAQPMSLSVGTNPAAQSNLTIPFSNVSQNPPPPAAPTNVTAMAKSSSEIDLTWMASTTTGVTYNVYRSTTAGFTPGAGNLIGNVSTTAFADMGLTPATNYYYIVAATSTNGTSPAPQAMAMTQANPTTTSLSLGSTVVVLNGTETLTAKVAPTAATGTVTFFDGTTTLAKVALSGSTAVFTTGALSGGSHSFTAMYSGDSMYAASTSSAQVLSVPTVAPDFAITAPPSSVLIGAGQSASFPLSVTSVGNFAGTVSFSCSGLPGLSTCSFNPQTVTVGASTPGMSTMTITTTGSSTTTANNRGLTHFGGRSTTLAMLPMGLCALLFATRKRKRLLRMASLASVLLMALTMMSGCSSATKSTGTSVNTITVTVTSGGVSHSTTVTLDVQQY